MWRGASERSLERKWRLPTSSEPNKWGRSRHGEQMWPKYDVGTFNGGNVWQQSPRETYYRHIIKISRLTSLLRFMSMTPPYGNDWIGLFDCKCLSQLRCESQTRLPSEATHRRYTDDGVNEARTLSPSINTIECRECFESFCAVFTLIKSRTQEIFIWEG